MPCEAGSNVKISVVQEFAALDSRKDEWNRLVGRSPTNNIFQTFEFHSSWWKVFGGTGRLLVLLAEADGQLIGIAPLIVTERSVLGRTQRVVQFIGARAFDYCDFIVDRARPEVLPLLLAKLIDSPAGFDLLYFRDIPETSTTVDQLRIFFEQYKLPMDIRVLYEAPTHLFNDPVADRQLPNKKSLKRHYNYFQRSGQLEFKNYGNAEEVRPYLDVFFEQHVRRRAPTDTPSLFLDDRMRSFFRELVQTLAPQGWLVLSVVSFNKKPIAMHFGFEYGNRITWYKPAFEIDFAKHSPGEVLIKYLLEYALERKVHELDFTIGAEAFKYRFANHARSNYVVRVYRHRAVYHLNRLMLEGRAFVERFPAVTRVARKALSRWRNQPWV